MPSTYLETLDWLDALRKRQAGLQLRKVCLGLLTSAERCRSWSRKGTLGRDERLGCFVRPSPPRPPLDRLTPLLAARVQPVNARRCHWRIQLARCALVVPPPRPSCAGSEPSRCWQRPSRPRARARHTANACSSYSTRALSGSTTRGCGRRWSVRRKCGQRCGRATRATATSGRM